jgi:hypothetical protein
MLSQNALVVPVVVVVVVGVVDGVDVVVVVEEGVVVVVVVVEGVVGLVVGVGVGGVVDDEVGVVVGLVWGSEVPSAPVSPPLSAPPHPASTTHHKNARAIPTPDLNLGGGYLKVGIRAMGAKPRSRVGGLHNLSGHSPRDQGWVAVASCSAGWRRIRYNGKHVLPALRPGMCTRAHR